MSSGKFFFRVFVITSLHLGMGSCFAQTFDIVNGDTINLTDENNLKQGLWKIDNKIKKMPGYEDGQLIEEGSYVNGKKEGVWKAYFNNGKTKSEITFSNNVPKGYAKFYYKNGFISEEGLWVNNKWEGKYKYYHENGNLAYDWNFVNGKREGPQKYYHENGRLKYDGAWAGGQEAGTLKEYNEKGQLVAEKVYNSGKIDTIASRYITPPPIPDPPPLPPQQTLPSENNTATTPAEDTSVGVFTGSGFHKLYNSAKQISREGTFSNGYLIEGKEYKYAPNGKLIKTLIYKNGKITSVIE